MSPDTYKPHPPKDPVAQKFRTFVKGLTGATGELTLAKAARRSKKDLLKTANADLQTKEELYQKANRIFHEYVTIKKEISIKLQQRAVELHGRPASGSNGTMVPALEGNIPKAKDLSTELTTALNLAITCLKTANKKISDVLDKANDLERIIKDPCNDEEERVLNQRCDNVEEEARKLTKKVVHVCEISNNTFHTSVKTAGINAQVNTESLSAVGESIKVEVNDFTTNVDDCLDALRTRLDAARGDFFTAIQTLCHCRDDLKIAKLRLDALRLLKVFADPKATRTIDMPIDDIVVEAKKNFEFVIGPEHLQPQDAAAEDEDDADDTADEDTEDDA